MRSIQVELSVHEVTFSTKKQSFIFDLSYLKLVVTFLGAKKPKIEQTWNEKLGIYFFEFWTNKKRLFSKMESDSPKKEYVRLILVHSVLG